VSQYRGQDVAVKILKLQDMPEEMLDEFDREIDLMNKLRHKNIVQFIGASKVVGKLAILTEFIEFGNCAHVSNKPCFESFMNKS
jgi:serine/threonine protein kinase